jgi:hypothetical protein
MEPLESTIFIETQKEPLEALVDVPVEVAKVVAGLIVAMVGELDAAAALFRASLGAQTPSEDLLADQGQVVELPLKLVVEELLAIWRAPRRGEARETEGFKKAQRLLPSPPSPLSRPAWFRRRARESAK